MNKSDSIKELATALALAQGTIENASKNATNPAFKSKYADLAEIINTVRPVFSEHGLSVVQFPSFDAGVASVETVVMHKSGEWMSGIASAPITKQDAQGVGSAITYLRRYSLAAVAGIAQEDEDANSAVGHSPRKQDIPKPISADQAAKLRAAIAMAGQTEAQFCAASKLDSVESLTTDRFDAAMKYLHKQAAA
jgi:hypothetical protein